MQIVIDIPRESYELLQTDGVDWLGAEHILDAVAKGTPLPEHHSELVDKREVYKKFYNRCLAHVAGEVLSEATTVIPAATEPTRTMLDCYKCKNNKADVDCEECHFELKPCINYEDGCEEWAGCPCVHYMAESEG